MISTNYIFGKNYNPSLFGSITDLSAGEVYGKGSELFFTPPSSTYAISHYEVFVNGVYHENITAVDMVIDLSPEASYTIKIRPVDINSNIGEFSNEITVNTPVWQSFLFDNFPQFVGVYGLKRLTTSATNCVRIKRSSDNAEVDLQLPASGFITLSSTVTGGQTLQSWAGTDTVEITVIYDQVGLNNLPLSAPADPNKGKGVLMRNGALYLEATMPYLRIEKPGNGTSNNLLVGFTFSKTGFNGSTDPGTLLTQGSVFSLYRNNLSNLALSDSDLSGFSEAYNSLIANKKKWQFKTDNTQRFYGARADGIAPIQINNLRSDFKSGDNYSGWVNGQTNINTSIIAAPSSHVYGLCWQVSDGALHQTHLLSAVAVTNLERSRRLIEQQINLEFNNYI